MISSSNWKPHFHDYGSKDTNDIFYSFYSLGLLRSTIQWFSLKNWLLNSSQWVCYGNSDHQDNLAEKKACKAMDTISTIRNVKSFRHWLFSSNKNVKQKHWISSQCVQARIKQASWVQKPKWDVNIPSKLRTEFPWLVMQANVAAGSNFNFHKLLTRTFDDDFEQVVGIR